jgi:signal peptidase I
VLWLLFLFAAYGYGGPPVDVYAAVADNMRETLIAGDYYIGSRDAYRDDPDGPRTPQRGDVALFRPYAGDRRFFASRVIGLPGDDVEMSGGEVVLNGTPLERTEVVDPPALTLPGGVRRFTERLPNGVRYVTRDSEPDFFLDDTPVVHVPAGQYFLLGDNRDNSTDSRVAGVGTIPLERFLARAGTVILSISPGTGALRPDRILMVIR